METDSEPPDSVCLSNYEEPSLEMPKIYVAESKHGKGVFAARDITNGEEILTPIGKKISYEESINPSIENHCMQIGENKYLAPSGDSKEEYFLINHSCNPNAGLNGDRTITAIRDIKKDEEIRFDYSTCMGDGSWTLECSCGELNCRGIIKDFKELPEEIKEK